MTLLVPCPRCGEHIRMVGQHEICGCASNPAELIAKLKRHASQLLNEYLHSGLLEPSKRDIKAYGDSFNEAASALAAAQTPPDREAVARLIIGHPDVDKSGQWTFALRLADEIIALFNAPQKDVK